MLKIVNFSKSYSRGGEKAVDGLNLCVDCGDLFAFIGHNGAGKTTTLKAVAGILPFEEGTIEIDGTNILTEPLQVKQKTAYIPDEPYLYDTQTGAQYLNFVADVFGISTAEREQAIEYYAGLLELRKSLNNPINSYSHGMKQKLQLISAFIHKPKLMMMDEPFVGLDPKASFTLKQLMRDFCDKGGAIFFSTHVLEVAEKLCDKVAIIKNGKLAASGTMDEIRGDNSLEEVFLELTDNEK